MPRITFIADELSASDPQLAAAIRDELQAAAEEAVVPAGLACRILVQRHVDGSAATIRLQFERPGAILSVALDERDPLATARERAASTLRRSEPWTSRFPPRSSLAHNASRG